MPHRSNRFFARSLVFLLALSPFALGLAGCSTYKADGGSITQRTALEDRTDVVIERFKNADPSIARFFDNAHGYVVFPKIGKGGIAIGAANGTGVVYEKGTRIGYAEVTQVTFGAQLGGQSYAQVIFFETAYELKIFKESNLNFSAQASAVAATKGAAATADYAEGIAVFTTDQKGLMFEASIGGQKFRYTPR